VRSGTASGPTRGAGRRSWIEWQRNHELRLFKVICDKLSVTVKSFLGAGAFGRCFMFELNNSLNHAKRALKIVLTLHDTYGFTEKLVYSEFKN
jgi:hypothetical protein